MELQEYVLKNAISSGICKPWADRIRKANGADELLQMYIDGIDFCLNNDFPRIHDLLNYGGDKLHQYGICIDKKSLNLDNKKLLVLLGSCETDLNYSGFSVSQLFVKHNSKATIIAGGNSFTVVDCFDTALLNVNISGNAKMLVNVYGQGKVSTKTEGKGIIKIVHKHKNNY